MALEIVSRSEGETAAMASALAKLLKVGDTVFLTGQLGSGKTFFVRSTARALGVTEPVTSPSFTMAQTYTGLVTVHHLDLYRLSGFSAEDAMDFDEYFEEDAITFVEWPEQAVPFIERPAIIIRLEHLDIHSRRITFECFNDKLKTGLEKLVADAGF